MEENKKVVGGEFLTPAQFAAKWWADRLDGTVSDIRLDKQFVERAELEKIIHPEHTEDVDDIIETLKDAKGKELSTLLLFPAERQKFEEELTKFIEKDLATKRICNLCVEEDGAQLAFAWAAEKAEIDFGENSVFTFAPFVEMFVSADKVEVRFDENDFLETIFEKYVKKQQNAPQDRQTEKSFYAQKKEFSK